MVCVCLRVRVCMCVDMCLCECMRARAHTLPASAVLGSGCEVVAAILAGERVEAGQEPLCFLCSALVSTVHVRVAGSSVELTLAVCAHLWDF